METLYLGYPTNYWIELHKKAKKLDDGKISVDILIEEIGKLRAKVNFYESRLDQINVYRKIEQ